MWQTLRIEPIQNAHCTHLQKCNIVLKCCQAFDFLKEISLWTDQDWWHACNLWFKKHLICCHHLMKHVPTSCCIPPFKRQQCQVNQLLEQMDQWKLITDEVMFNVKLHSNTMIKPLLLQHPCAMCWQFSLVWFHRAPPFLPDNINWHGWLTKNPPKKSNFLVRCLSCTCHAQRSQWQQDCTVGCEVELIECGFL